MSYRVGDVLETASVAQRDVDAASSSLTYVVANDLESSTGTRRGPVQTVVRRAPARRAAGVSRRAKQQTNRPERPSGMPRRAHR